MPDTAPTGDQDRMPTTAATACEWCGRAVKQNAEGRWYAVKGEERGYDPLTCEATGQSHTTNQPEVPRQLVQVGWYGPYGIVPGGMDNDPAPHWRPLYVER